MKRKPFHVGDKVAVKIGNTVVHAVIVEDRGPIGADGRQLVRLRTVDDNSDDDDSSIAFDMPVEQLAT